MDGSKKKDELTEAIIGCAHKVLRTLGCGFLEKVYENAFAIELSGRGIRHEQQASVEIRYQGLLVGEYIADIVVENRVIVELKAVRDLDRIHQAQLLNYLKATGIRTGLLLNFGTTRLGIKRMVL